MENTILVRFLGIIYFCSGQWINNDFNDYIYHTGRSTIKFGCGSSLIHIPSILMLKEYGPDNEVKEIAYMESKVGVLSLDELNITVNAEKNWSAYYGFCDFDSAFNYCSMSVQFEISLDRCSTIQNYTKEYSCFEYSLDGRELQRSDKSGPNFQWFLENRHSVDNVSVANNRLGESFIEGDVLRLSCQGDVTTADGLSYDDIHWCSGYMKLVSLQDQPISEIITRSEDDCSEARRSTIYYHITSADTSLDITCESVIPVYGPCLDLPQLYRATSSITIKSEAKGERIIGQILVYSEDDVTDPNNIVLTSYGKLLYLMCVASRQLEHAYLTIRWCQRESSGAWVNARLQNPPVTAASKVSNSSAEIYSRIAYHVTQEHDNITFLCELDNNPTCGNGTSSRNITLHVFTKDGTEAHININNLAGTGNTENVESFKNSLFTADGTGIPTNTNYIKNMVTGVQKEESSASSVLIAGISLIVISALIWVALAIFICLAIRTKKVPGLKVEFTWNKKEDGKPERSIGNSPASRIEGATYQNAEFNNQATPNSNKSLYDTLDIVDSPSHYEQLQSH